jgi:hypothetical protein
MCLKRIVFLLYHYHIREHFVFFRRIAQKRGGVVYGTYIERALSHELPVLARYFEIGLYKSHGGDSAEANYNFRAYSLNLRSQMVYASVLLLGQRVAVFGRTAF